MNSALDQLKAQFLPRVEELLEETLRNSGAKACGEMTRYHMETGGKRLRALIPLYVFQTLGRLPEDALALGAGVEMIHNATLVHDDLQDGDEVRRDRPTVWKKYSAAQAINCGDAMFHYAVRLLCQLKIEPAALARLLDRAALATIQVIEGQAQEFLMKEEECPGTPRYLEVIRGKTSGLFAFPIVGAMEALGMDRGLCAQFETAAMDLGALFQIQDDVLDIYGKKGRGDQRATDIAEGKISFFVAYANEVAGPEDRGELRRILRLPRERTTDREIQFAMDLFERVGCRAKAAAVIREIRRGIEANAELRREPRLHTLLLELAEVFLEPVHGVL